MWNNNSEKPKAYDSVCVLTKPITLEKGIDDKPTTIPAIIHYDMHFIPKDTVSIVTHEIESQEDCVEDDSGAIHIAWENVQYWTEQSNVDNLIEKSIYNEKE